MSSLCSLLDSVQRRIPAPQVSYRSDRLVLFPRLAVKHTERKLDISVFLMSAAITSNEGLIYQHYSPQALRFLCDGVCVSICVWWGFFFKFAPPPHSQNGNGAGFFFKDFKYTIKKSKLKFYKVIRAQKHASLQLKKKKIWRRLSQRVTDKRVSWRSSQFM